MKYFKKTIFTLFIILTFYNNVLSQNKFMLEIDAPDYINQTIQIANYNIIHKNLNEFYKFKLDIKNKMIEKRDGLAFDIYKIKIQKNNIINGESILPIAVCFLTMDTITNQVFITAPFFLDTGYIKINLPKINTYYELNLNTPLNVEFKKFKELFSNLYVESPNYNHLFGFDSLTSMPEKQNRIKNYIINNPNSYFPLWECIDDYIKNNRFKNNISLIKNTLRYFSETIKKTDLYKNFIDAIKQDSIDAIKQDSIELIDKITLIKGIQLPDFKLNKKINITKEYFKNYKLTLVDFWATWCKPCVESFPEMVKMYNQYKTKGVNFISIAEETTPEKFKLANDILKKNRVEWINYFDKNKELNKKIIYEGIPFQILVDKDGKVITAVSSDLETIKQTIEEYLK